MKKYRLIKKYMLSPSLGSEVFEVENGYVFEGYTFPKQVVEDYPEFWEEVIKKDWILTGFKSKNSIATLRKNGKFLSDIFESSNNINEGASYETAMEMFKCGRIDIVSIKLVSNGEIFKIGDLVNYNKKSNYGNWKIFDFLFKDNRIMARSENTCICEYIEDLKHVVEKEYEIVKVLSNVEPEKNVLLTYDSNGVCINRTDKPDCSHTVNLKHVLKISGVVINCVKRLFDNKLFYVGEETNFGKIKGFDIESNDLVALFFEDAQLLRDIQHVNEEFEIITYKITESYDYDRRYINTIVPLMFFCGSVGNRGVINSVKRDVDQQVFTVGDIVKDHENSIDLKIESFEVRRKRGVGRHFFGENLIWVSYEGDFMGNWLNNIIKTEQKPIFTTEDGVEIFKGDQYYCVHFRDIREIQPSFNKIPLFDIYGPCKAFIESDGIKYTKDAKYFSTEKKAKEYVKLNEPKYSLQDILNARIDYIIPEVGAIAIDFEELENKK